jgi:hypothetical protein
MVADCKTCLKENLAAAAARLVLNFTLKPRQATSSSVTLPSKCLSSNRQPAVQPPVLVPCNTLCTTLYSPSLLPAALHGPVHHGIQQRLR